jgi:hypothetical protein
MKTSAAILMFGLLSSAAGASLADVHVYVNCDAADAKCPRPPKPPKPPRPPAPPAPPVPPAPPAPDAAMAYSPADAAMPAMPAMPAIPVPPTPPAPPAPPPPPKVPPVPDSAHADCASRKPGTRLTFTLRPGETMTGVCQKQDGRMVFSLREYQLTE